ncbi:hypothetical protein J2S13_002972 [Oikeobacillus pervagus]|uniref:Uncharacterized protein n=1 Tax=Oikeobacillus pervagus TaxID=1325931 RepID=A0AAJ1WHS2_9BACI|nr:DUF3189 family protein [Oikeobacillus pervagus]MDQ0216512.1 hypothetical protein [Oikeobacillus pervagus]
MIYIYNDYGGTHTTSLAASYHLKKLPTNRRLTTDEILNVDYFNKLDQSDKCKLIFHGIDDEGNPVYTIGRRSSKLVIPALKNLSLLFQARSQINEKIIFSNTSPTVPFTMTMGGFFSRGLKMDTIGVPLLITGAKKCCDTIFQLVKYTRKMAEETNEKVLVLENKEFKP